MKKFLVVLLACVMIFGFATTALAADTQIKEFSDIADQSQAAKNAIMKLAVLGVIEGNEGIGGAYRPADNLTRAEFAKIVCYLTGNVKLAESLASVGTKFSDVSTGNWYTGWVNAAAQSGYYVGDPGGTFRPNANITMQEVVTVALRAAGYTDKLGSSTGNTTWPANYVTKAMNVGMLDDVTFVGSAAATRSDMAIICNEVLGINMVVHISNDIAYALALSDGTVDPDGFSEVYYISNETYREKIEETILHKAFDGEYWDLEVNFAAPVHRTNAPTDRFDETAGWYYEDFATGELALNLSDSRIFNDDKKFESWSQYRENSTSDWDDYYYSQGEALTSTYYITRDFDLTELSGMQVQVIVIDEKEICFVDVVSSYLMADSIYLDRTSATASTQNINVDGKSYRPSATMGVRNSIDRLGEYFDLSKDYYFLANVGDDDDTVLNLNASYDDDDFNGKIYLDKDGRVYATKNYAAYDGVNYDVVKSVESSYVDWKGVGGFDFETDKNYTMYKDGEQIKADELEENDLIYYLGTSTGAHFFLASAPLEADFTKQTNTALTLDGVGYGVDENPFDTSDDGSSPLFLFSDDGGETFIAYSIRFGPAIDSFGDAIYTKAYNFSNAAYVASNVSATKIIGVVTNVDPVSVWDGTSFNPQVQKVTIYNAEGKEVTYTFAKNFKNAYNRAMGGNYVVDSGATARWGTTYAGTLFDDLFPGGIQEGDIVQITLDTSDNVKKLNNYASFDARYNDSVATKVTSSTNRINITNNGSSHSSTGSYTLNKDAVVYAVTAEGTSYDDVSIQSVSSTLAADFDSSKVVAFDIKNTSDVRALYIISGTSVAQYGVLTQVGADTDGWWYTMNGSELRADEPGSASGYNYKTRQRHIVAYQVSGGEATIVRTIAGRGFVNLPLTNPTTDGSLKNYTGVQGVVNSYNSSYRSLSIGTNNTIVYLTSDTYMYDFSDNSSVTNAANFRGKHVVAYYNDDSDAYFVVIVNFANGDAPVVNSASSQSETVDLNAARALVNGEISNSNFVVPASAPIATTANKAAAIEAVINDLLEKAGIELDTVAAAYVPASGEVAAHYEITLTKGGTTITITVSDVVAAAASSDKTVYTILDQAVPTWTGTDLKVGSIDVATDVATLLNTDIVPNHAYADVILYSDAFGSSTVSVSLNAAGNTTTVYFQVKAEDNTVANYQLKINRADSALPVVTTVTIDNTAPQVGDTLDIDDLLDADDGSIAGALVNYQWQIQLSAGSSTTYVDIIGETSATYIVRAGDLGRKIQVVVTGKGVGATGTVTSDPTAAVAAAPTPVTFTATQVGGLTSTATTTSIEIVFDQVVTGLADGDITIVGATKGVLTGSGDTYRVAISGVTEGNITVSVADFGSFDVTTTAQTVAVYEDTTAPTVNAVATNATTVVLTFSEAVDMTDKTGWDVGVAGGSGSVTSVDSVSGSGTTWTLTLTATMAYDDTITVTYDGSGDVEDLAGNALSNTTSITATNSI